MINEQSAQEQNEPHSFEQRFAKAVELHNEAVRGNTDAVWKAHHEFESLRTDHPGHPLADAFHGSVMSLIARDESNPLTRFQWANRSLKLLDESVASAPTESRIRKLRGNIAFRLPEEIFHRTETVIEDYLFLINEELCNPGSLSLETYNKLIYELGEAYHRVDRLQEAKMCWSKLLKQTEDPEYHRLVEQKLQIGMDEKESSGR
ncbi:hypothetical protein [Paenibacillus jiagnxiensis]|uniref:hypothetical protein n=1 Tax=Paenibacillus jiagnxiensis TaxID=3228926 RepID=UPI0033AB2266